MRNGFSEKYDQLKSAVERLQEAIAACQAAADESSKDILRDSVIKRFEICTELSWKTIREYQIDQGLIPLNSPKSVLKRAYADELISGEASWMRMIADRNLTSHTYDEKTAEQIYSNICDTYTELLENLLIKLQEQV